MARDPGLEAQLNDDLAGLPGLTQKTMFGGLAWLLDNKLLCGARRRGMMVRLGKGNDAWALAIAGVTQMHMQGRPAHGWLDVAPEVVADDAVRRRLLEAAIAFVKTLPGK